MARLNVELQNELEPKRMEFAKKELAKLGIVITFESKTELNFLFNGKTIYFFPYSGWHSGSGIKSGRGIKKLLNQLK